MITKKIPGFSFIDPTVRVVNLRVESCIVVGEPRVLRTVWTPELAQDVAAFQNIDAEAELTALLAEQVGQEIDREILRNLTNRDDNRIYQNLRQWNDLINIHHGHRAPQDNPEPDFGNIILPIARRVAAQTIGLDLVNVQPLAAPQGLLHYIDYNLGIDNYDYTVLPNEEGWFMDGTFESIFINMKMKPHEFIEKIRRTRRGRRSPQVNRQPNNGLRTVGNPPNYQIRDYRI